MADECCNIFGGRISIEADGVVYPARGDVTIEPTNYDVSADANHDGSMFVTKKPKLYKASMTLSQPCGLKWNDALSKCKVNVTITEEESGATHMFTAAAIVGTISRNLSTGEVTGFGIASAKYREV